MKETQKDSLAKAIADLGAVEVAPGRYAFKGVNGYGEPRWLIGTAEQISDPDDMPIIETVMPAWWSPSSRETYVWPDGFTVKRITADLSSGEEVPA
jgi:hypothetical protein